MYRFLTINWHTTTSEDDWFRIFHSTWDSLFFFQKISFSDWGFTSRYKWTLSLCPVWCIGGEWQSGEHAMWRWPHSCVPRTSLKCSLLFPEESLSFSSFFHFIRRFWNQILTCRSERLRVFAISLLRELHRYLLKWNSFSSSKSCLFV